MKRLISLLSASILCISLVSCGNNDSINVEQTDNTSTAGLYDCFEFDIESESFTDNILISFNIPEGYTATEQESLLYQNPKYYIGDFKNASENKTISVYEYTEEFNELICTKLSDEWYVSNLPSEEYICSFYNPNMSDKFTLVVNIVNTDKKELDLQDGLSLFNYITNKDFEITTTTTDAEDIEDKTYEVEASVKNPAKLDEFISTYVRNPNTGVYEPVLIAITNISTNDSYNEEIINQYRNDLQSLQEYYEKKELPVPFKNTEIKTLENDCSYVIMNYSIYFPSTYSFGENFELPISLCNHDGTSSTIKGILNLSNTIQDIVIDKSDITSGSIWENGILVYQIPTAFNKYLIKLAPSNGYDAKYINVN